MSVLIRGMDMPKNCSECKIKTWDEYENGYVCPFSGISALSIGRQDDCPLEEPERTGRWVNVRHDNVAECSCCGITGRAWMNFCFDCGADMRTAKYGTKIDLCIMDEVEGLPSAQQEHTKEEDA